MPISGDHHSPHGGPPPPPKPNQKLVSLLLKAVIMTLITSLFFIFLGFAAIALLHLFLAGHAFRRRRRPTTNPSALSPQDLKRVPQFTFKTQGLQSQSECVVCLERLREGQWCRRFVGCNHVFHRKCIDAWLLKKAACPICRMHVNPALCLVSEDSDNRLWSNAIVSSSGLSAM